MLKRIFAIGAGIGVGLLCSVGAVHLGALWGFWPNRELERSTAQVREVMRLVHERYVDEQAVSYEALKQAALDGIAASLDQHSGYLTAEDYHLLQEEIGNEFGGIGVQVEMMEGKLTVVAPIRGTPGDRAGLLRGDQIESIEGEPVGDADLMALIARLRGKPGTEVAIGVRRPSEDRSFELTIRREVIRVDSVKTVAPDADGIGVIEIVHFGEKTGGEFRRALDRLRAEGMRALVIDLRDNPGGLLNAAVEVAGPFFHRNELVVYTQGRDPADRIELRSDGRDAVPSDLPVAVLINGGSASASEIVAGALKDTGRAVLVGDKSYGKGSVQTLYPLRGDEALRLTTAKYFTPSGVVIHGQGIPPDIEVKLAPDEEKAVALQHLRADLTDPAEFKERFGVDLVPDRQLEAAKSALRDKLAPATATAAVQP
ncbi:MAG: S41 family peptidase [Verrucomicrobiota bacterium]